MDSNVKKSPLKHLRDKTCAIIGFGSQGRAQALNLKESGVSVIIGLLPKSKSRTVAKKLGFKVYNTSKAVKKADVILLALPDLKIPAIYEKEIAPFLSKGNTLLFAHGFVIHYKMIESAKGINVVMVAPKGGPGPSVRRQFLKGNTVPVAIAIHQDPSKNSKKIALAWARGIGSGPAGVFETTFKEETEADLFGEQALLCGGLTSLVHAGFETLIEAGYQPEMAYLETLHELKLVIDLVHESGISGMRRSISETACYGDLTVGPLIIDGSVKKRMKQALQNIQSGKFAKEWIKEHHSGYKNYQKLLKAGEKHPVEAAGKKIQKRIRKKHSEKTPFNC